ncbi:MAG: hypothetical protein QOE07_2827 [Acidimicrobiaceae bacterium]|nr:hypothetical protein [Acidimicrobiaceae bacterium]
MAARTVAPVVRSAVANRSTCCQAPRLVASPCQAEPWRFEPHFPAKSACRKPPSLVTAGLCDPASRLVAPASGLADRTVDRSADAIRPARRAALGNWDRPGSVVAVIGPIRLRATVVDSDRGRWVPSASPSVSASPSCGHPGVSLAAFRGARSSHRGFIERYSREAPPDIEWPVGSRRRTARPPILSRRNIATQSSHCQGRPPGLRWITEATGPNP